MRLERGPYSVVVVGTCCASEELLESVAHGRFVGVVAVQAGPGADRQYEDEEKTYHFCFVELKSNKLKRLKMIVDSFINDNREVRFLGEGSHGVVFAFKSYVVKISTHSLKKEIDCIIKVNTIRGIPKECMLRYKDHAYRYKNGSVVKLIKAHVSNAKQWNAYERGRRIYYLVTENTADLSLSEFLDGNRIECSCVLDIIRQMLWIFYIFHKNSFYHRDPHEKNVLLKYNSEGRSIKFDFPDKNSVTINPRYIVLPIDYELCAVNEKERLNDNRREDVHKFLTMMSSNLEYVVESGREKRPKGRGMNLTKLTVYTRKFVNRMNDFFQTDWRSGTKRYDFVDQILKELICSRMFGVGKI